MKIMRNVQVSLLNRSNSISGLKMIQRIMKNYQGSSNSSSSNLSSSSLIVRAVILNNSHNSLQVEVEVVITSLVQRYS